jgi:hypothetical protein
MLENISNYIESVTPNTKMICLVGAGAFLGRNVIKGMYCKVGATVSQFMEQQNVAEWNKASEHYFVQARKNALRDLAVATGLIFIGVGFAGIVPKEELIEESKKFKFESTTNYAKIGSILGSIGGAFTGAVIAPLASLVSCFKTTMISRFFTGGHSSDLDAGLEAFTQTAIGVPIVTTAVGLAVGGTTGLICGLTKDTFNYFIEIKFRS